MRVFISYSWDSDEHKARVANLVKKLRDNGVGAEFDGDIMLGERIPQYMESRVADSDFVLFICTPKFKAKADNRAGGVGYESNIITGEIFNNQNEKKFIPILFAGTWETSLPTWASGKNGLDFTSEKNAQNEYRRLLEHLGKKPVSIEQPTFPQKASVVRTENEMMPDNVNEPIRIIRVITEEVGFPKNDGTRGSALYAVPFELSRNPSELWRNLFVQCWNFPPQFTSLHRPGIARVSGRRIILDGTTIDEVERTHKQTLLLAVGEANKKEQEHLRIIAMETSREKAERESHLQNVRDAADRLTF